jgi:high affinity Mn2+ porin
MASIGLFGFWAGLWMASRRYPSEYDWRYMTISSLLYPDRDPGGFLWAWSGLLLCALGGLCWVAVLFQCSSAERRGVRSSGIWSLALGYFCMISCAVWPGRLLDLPRGHDLLALLAFVGICIGTVQLTYLAVLRRMRRRALAGLVAGVVLLPLLLEAITQADVSRTFPHLPWVGLEWRARGVPVYLSFAFWEWSTCVMLSAYTMSLSMATMRISALLAIGVLCGSAPRAWAADESPDSGAQPVVEQRFAIHGQITYVVQADDGFHAPYAGRNSLTPARNEETVDATLFVGARLWRGAEIWIQPEMDQGFGLDDTLGVAGFPSGEAYKVGANHPYFRWQRAFVRQVIDEGNETEPVQAVANQLGGSRSADRWVVTLGKFSVTDIFDTNQYAHDPRSDFLNWAAVDGGAFDYAADAWGYTVGAAVERYAGAWTLRAGVFDLSNVPNSIHLDPGMHEFQIDAEVEKRYPLFGQTGRLLLTAFESRGRMALLDETIALAQTTGVNINTALVDVRRYRSRLGGVLSLEQPITEAVGVFARLSKAAGNVEAYEFSDIDRSVALGTSVKGLLWHRPDDTVGLAAIDNGISAERELYLNSGGLGILVGDGQLPRPGAEQILETYYICGALPWASVSLDYQWVKNPAYNTERGPVSIFAVRVHAQF